MKRFICFLILFSAIFASLNVFVIDKKYTYKFSPVIEKDYIVDMNAIDHDVILLGDSLLHNNLDMELITQKIGKPVQRVIQYGSGSAMWYLMLKNYFVQLDKKPEAVIIFFHNSMLTTTTYHTQDEYFDMMDVYASGADELVLEMIRPNQSRIDKLLNQIPLVNARAKLKSKFEEKVRFHFLRKYFHKSIEDIDSYIGLEFNAPLKIRKLYWEWVYAQIRVLFADENLDFDKQIDKSFLPLMINVAKENGIKLSFVRFPVLEDRYLSEESSQLNDYNRKLTAYFSSQGIPYLDMANLYTYPRLLFFDPVHMNIIGRTVFSKQFIKELGVITK